MDPDVDPIHPVVDRVAMENPAPAMLSGYEIDGWPPEAVRGVDPAGTPGRNDQGNIGQLRGCERKCQQGLRDPASTNCGNARCVHILR